MNLIEKLAKLREMCEVIAKNKSGYSYKYVSIDEILARVTAGMKKYHVSLIPRVENMNVSPYTYKKTKVTKNGEIYEENVNEMFATGSVVYKWVNEEDTSDYIEVPWHIAGSQTDPAQALGSAMTYGLRYFLMDYFQITALDSEDPDAWKAKQIEAEKKEAKEVAKKIIDKVHEIVPAYVSEHPEAKDEAYALIMKYAKEKGKPSKNYFAIEDPETAAKLLEEVVAKYTKNT